MRFNKFNDPALTSFGNPNVLGRIPGLVSQVLRLHRGRIRELVDTAKSSMYYQGLGDFGANLQGDIAFITTKIWGVDFFRLPSG